MLPLNRNSEIVITTWDVYSDYTKLNRVQVIRYGANTAARSTAS